MTPKSGALNLSSLNFDLSGADNTAGYALRSSADGFATNIATANAAAVYLDFAPVSVSLAGAQYQGLGATTFRFYAYGPTAFGPNDLFDNITLSSAAAPAVPEPGSIALLVGMGMSGAGFLVRRRRRAGK